MNLELQYEEKPKMAKLRAYERNGGDMLELVRYQKRTDMENWENM